MMAAAQGKDTTGKASDNVARDIEREIADLRADVAALARSLKDYGGLRAGEAKERAEEMSAEAMDEALKAVREMRRRLNGLEKQLEGNVNENPLAWVLGALGVGMLFGMLFSRRD